MNSPRLLQLHRDADDAAEAAAGLLRPHAALAPKFFYDAQGSALFDAITRLDEYYPTRTEAAILAEHGTAIADAVRGHTGPAPVIVDLGAGNCAKGAALCALLAPQRYVAVDICAEHLAGALAPLQREHPALELVGVGLDFSRRLELPAGLAGTRALVFYAGSSIGNFDPVAALELLRQARALAGSGALLIGVDLVKASDVLEAAYDDALGVTAAFNLNVLRHLNTLLGADFDLRQWRHVAHYERAASRIEMHLEARAACLVRWRGGQRAFAAGERIHTENSYKWTRAAFAALLREAGFGEPRHWSDARGWFALFVAGGRGRA
ncbi:MAG TPA: L-histidine N(alpha)-methyltransferase [Rubrivivax sp.]|mgnify:CR=1 FL=1|nr:L-histidine N(alpha)-methyltransferase [Rubrivivax sp.]